MILSEIPTAWIIAHKVMITMVPKLSLRVTDCSYIQCGEESISHILNIAKAHDTLTLDRRAMNSLTSKGVVHLSNAGSWLSMCNSAIKFVVYEKPPGNAKWTEKLKENWLKLTNCLNEIKAEWFTIGCTDLMLSRDKRRSNTESYITTMALIQPT
jgi:hypothetical protein